ncbi:DUF2628 domain-containing protein [Paenibacillus faecis]|uniref:DUF2628 domain-containing protein n=1 Tax=Paenibacillus faecis TaxID=862114 RepID=A0A5D0CQC0_9BACL|nr:DUF2628 domain-containing protein [Paenibacillus faecis]
MYCSNCGKGLYEDDKFCVNCGAPVKTRELERESDGLAPFLNSAAPNPHPEQARRNTAEPFEEDYSLFIGKRAEEYLLLWKEDRHWNWPAFLFGGYWLLYRGMYLYFLLYLICLSLLVNVIRYLTFPAYYLSNGVVWTVIAAHFVLQVVFAAFANQIYFHHAQRKIRSLNVRFDRYPDLRKEKIESAGETSLYIPIALAVLPILIGIVSFLLYTAHIYKEINQEIRIMEQETSLRRSLETTDGAIRPA